MAVIGYNASAVNAAYYLNQNTNNLNGAIQELASGSRIANPSNDAAGVAVSGNMEAQISRLGAATQASQDVVSYAQTTDGFLSTVEQQLSRMSELAQSATNGSFGSADVANYNVEFKDLVAQIGTIFSSATFNGANIFSGTNATAGITVAVDANGTTDSMAALTVTNLTNLGLTSSSTISATNAGTMIGTLNTAIQSLTSSRAQVNADISKFNFYIQNQQTESTNLQSANSGIANVDVATESTALAKDNILLQASSAMLAQANSSQNALLSLISGH